MKKLTILLIVLVLFMSGCSSSATNGMGANEPTGLDGSEEGWQCTKITYQNFCVEWK